MAEIFDSMEGRIIRIMEIIRVIDRGAAKIENIVTLKEEIHVLQTDFFVILVTKIVKIGHNIPGFEIGGCHQGKQIARTSLFSVVNTGGNGIIFL